MTVDLSPVCRPYASMLSRIWIASSRVGVRIRARIGRRGVNDFFSHFPFPSSRGTKRSMPCVLDFSETWIASSFRVAGVDFASFWMIGMANAAVLPVPVCAQPRRSNPQRTIGIAFSWIGVGVVYPSSSRAFRIGDMSWSSEKSMRNQ